MVGFSETSEWVRQLYKLAAGVKMSGRLARHKLLATVMFVCAPNKVFTIGPKRWKVLVGDDKQEVVREPMIIVWP